jgi:dihydrofolate reductase
MQKQKVVAIVAMDEDCGIGRDDKIPWTIKSDLAHFRETTMGYPIIMGSTTFKSLSRPLPGRINIVLSRTHTCVEGCIRAANSQHALDIAAIGQHEKVFIIGGEQIYREFIQRIDAVDEIIVSRISGKHECTKKLWDFKNDGLFNFDFSATRADFKVEKYVRKTASWPSYPAMNDSRSKTLIKRNFLIDLDGTVCDDIPNEHPEKFLTAKVKEKCVETLNSLKAEGHSITFFTSRKKEHETVTRKWLHDNKFHYDEIIFDKPRHGRYVWIDNLNAVSLLVPDGGLPEFFPA